MITNNTLLFLYFPVLGVNIVLASTVSKTANVWQPKRNVVRRVPSLVPPSIVSAIHSLAFQCHSVPKIRANPKADDRFAKENINKAMAYNNTPANVLIGTLSKAASHINCKV